MKSKIRHYIFQLCMACAGIGFFFRYDNISNLLFGEPEPPIDEE